MSGTVLVVDTEAGVRNTLKHALELQGFRVVLAQDGSQASATLRRGRVDVALIEVFLRGENGLELLRRLSREGTPVEIVMTGLDLPPSVNQSFLEQGAFAFLPKPLDLDLTVAVLRKAIETQGIKRRATLVSELLGMARVIPDPVFADSDDEWLETVKLAAPTDLPILLHGEPGSGQMTVARLIHDRSDRDSQIFFILNNKGQGGEFIQKLFLGGQGAVGLEAFIDRFSEGTLVLEDIEQWPLSFQELLAEVIENKVLEHHNHSPKAVVSGGLPFSARFIVSLSMDLKSAELAGRVHPKLISALARVSLAIPPLRERKQAIPTIVEALLLDMGYQGRVSDDAMTCLSDYDWPGNLEELSMVLGQCSQGEVKLITAAELPASLRPHAASVRLGVQDDASLTLADVEKRQIALVLARQNGNKVRTARVLDINVKTLYNKIRLYNLDG